MRTSAAVLAGLVLAASVARTAAAQENVHGILFAASVAEDGRAVLEPVATLSANGFLAPADDPDAGYADAFAARWLMPGKRYDVLARGERIGGVSVVSRDEPGCWGTNVRGTLDVRGQADEGWRALAGEGLPEQRDAPWLREPTRAEERDLDRMAAALFHAHGIDVAARTRGDTAAAVVIGHPNARPMLVASYRLATEDAIFRQAALLVIAEDGQDGYRPAYAWFHDALGDDVESRTLIDAADLDGDGQPELVIRNGYYESWSFTILQRTGAGWVETYHGGGGGC